MVGLPANLASIQAAVGDFSGIASIESIQIGEDGTAYLTADLADGTGAILIVDQPDDLTTTRIISGPNTGLVAPKGLDVVDGSGLIVVAAIAVITSVGGKVLARWTSLNDGL